MKVLKIWAVVIMMTIMPLGLVGCGGGGAEVRTHTTTLGQELKDLEEAYQKGIITQKQYEKAKEKLIEQRTNK